MAYFRCGAERSRCSRARTGEVCSGSKWKCPAQHPECLSLRESVSFLHVYRRWLTGGAILLIVALIIGITIKLFTSNPLSGELQQAREQFTSIDNRIRDLEAQPIPRATPAGHFARIEEWSTQGSELRSSVETALAQNRVQVAKAAGETLTILSKNAEELARAIDGMHGKDAPRLIAAKPLGSDLGVVRKTTEGITERASDQSARDIIDDAEVLLDEIRTAEGRIARLLKTTGTPIDPAAVVQHVNSLKAASGQANDIIANHLVVPPLPFLEGEVTSVIAATGDLTENLVLPLLQNRARGEVEKSQDGRWFYKNGNERIIIYRSDEGALRDLVAGKVDLAIVDRPPSPEESANFLKSSKASLTSKDYAKTICYDALAFYVHAQNVRKQLTQDEARSLKCVTTGAGSPDRIVAERYGVPLITALKTPATTVQGDDKAVAVGLYHRNAEFAGLRALEVTGGPDRKSVAPSPFAISTEDYPFSFRITAHTNPQSRQHSRDFLQFAFTDQGQDTVAKQGYVDNRWKPPIGLPDPAIVAAIQSAIGSSNIKSITRLSTAFHFDVAEDRLDFKAVADLDRVPEMLTRVHPNCKLVILGFTDSTGTPQINVPLSKRRADFVASALQRAGLSATTVGLGDQTHSPESNLTEEGRYRNRRANIYVVEL